MAMQLIQEHEAQDLYTEYRTIEKVGSSLLQQQDFNGAADAFEAAYRFLLDQQPPGRRYHKGEALHNRGLALLWAGRAEEALTETLAAFVEDAASLAEESPRSLELERPAAHNLVFAFGLAGPPIAQFGRSVRAFIDAGNFLPDPHALIRSVVLPGPFRSGRSDSAAAEVAEAAQESVEGAAVAQATTLVGSLPETAQARKIGQLRLAPERAVFVGGGFVRLDSHLRPLRDKIDALGYEGVVAADFDQPHNWRSDEVAMALIGICHYGVFDLTDPAGQMVELADLTDRKKTPDRTLAVFDRRVTSKPRVSGGMTLERLADWGVEPKGYDSLEGLGEIVKDWLPSLVP